MKIFLSVLVLAIIVAAVASHNQSTNAPVLYTLHEVPVSIDLNSPGLTIQN